MYPGYGNTLEGTCETIFKSISINEVFGFEKGKESPSLVLSNSLAGGFIVFFKLYTPEI